MEILNQWIGLVLYFWNYVAFLAVVWVVLGIAGIGIARSMSRIGKEKSHG